MKKLGFIGLGAMGLPMCVNLIRKLSCEMRVYDVVTSAMEDAAAHGAIACADAAQVAQESDVIFTMLPRSEHVRSVYDALKPSVRPGQLYVEMSTISPCVSADIAHAFEALGAQMIDAPVVKSRPAAIAGKLGIYVGGSQAAYDRALPYLQCMGENALLLGKNGAGLVMKLCHNTLVAQIQNGVNETLKLAQKAGGIDVDTFEKAVCFGGGQNFYLTSKKDALITGDFAPAFALAYMQKDLNLAQELADEQALSLPGLTLAAERYAEAMDCGLGAEDFCATYKLQ